jgi:hypothetical protein
MTTWREVHVGFARDGLKIAGIDVWKHQWRKTGLAPLLLAHPSYPTQLHTYKIYDIGQPDSPVRFAACELSNGVWGFYVPDS